MTLRYSSVSGAIAPQEASDFNMLAIVMVSMVMLLLLLWGQGLRVLSEWLCIHWTNDAL
jgi:hypothetical protein